MFTSSRDRTNGDEPSACENNLKIMCRMAPASCNLHIDLGPPTPALKSRRRVSMDFVNTDTNSLTMKPEHTLGTSLPANITGQSSSRTHIVFTLPEVLSLICWNNSEIRSTLVNMALVCKTFKEPALDVLWYRLSSFESLLHIPPFASAPNTNSGVTVWKALVTLHGQGPELATVLNYTRRVREFELLDRLFNRFPFCGDPQILMFFVIGQFDIAGDLFPNLKSLAVNACALSSISGSCCYIAPFLNANTRCLRWTNLKLNNVYWDGGSVGEYIGECILFNFEHRRNLRVLHFTLDYSDLEEDSEWDIEESSYDLPTLMSIPDPYVNTLVQTCSYLVDVHIAPNADILHSLSRLPYLETLVLDLAHLNRTKHSSTDDKAHFGQQYPALQSLKVNCLSTLSGISDFFEGAGCFARHSLTIGVAEPFTSDDLTAVIRALIDPVRSARLDTFILELAFDPAAYESDEKGIDGKPEIKIKWDSVSPLLSCCVLRVLEISSKSRPTIPVPVPDELRKMAEAWPKIEFLTFNYELFARVVADHMGLCYFTLSLGDGAEYKFRSYGTNLDNSLGPSNESTCTLQRRVLDVDLVSPWQCLFPRISLPRYIVYTIGDETTVAFLPGEKFRRVCD